MSLLRVVYCLQYRAQDSGKLEYECAPHLTWQCITTHNHRRWAGAYVIYRDYHRPCAVWHLSEKAHWACFFST